tara:strand:- start:139 stop:378 length:240 start_codon:yes stop_codon:yes gene_type:complete
MFPASFFKTIKNKIMPDMMEVVFKLRTELEARIENFIFDTKKLKEQIDMLGGEISMLENRLNKLEILGKKPKKVKQNGK